MLGPEQIVEIDSPVPSDVLRALTDRAAAQADVDPELLFEIVTKREELCSTGFGLGVAMPHVRLENIRTFHTVLGRTRKGIEFGAIDGKPVHLLLLVVGPMADKAGYQKLMSRSARFLKAEAARVLEASDLLAITQEALADY
jgi:mannitol/fructose-specific phosphotransferase system IIA component (Ntr-type)